MTLALTLFQSRDKIEYVSQKKTCLQIGSVKDWTLLLEPGDRDHILSGVFNQFLSANPRASRINKKSANNPALID